MPCGADFNQRNVVSADRVRVDRDAIDCPAYGVDVLGEYLQTAKTPARRRSRLGAGGCFAYVHRGGSRAYED